MKKSTADILLGLTGGIFALSSRKGGANRWSNIPLQVLPSLDYQKRFAGLITATKGARDSLRARANTLEEMADMVLPSIIEGNFKSAQSYIQNLQMAYKGSANRQLKLQDVAEVKTNFPGADFWIQGRGSDFTVGRVWRKFSDIPTPYGTSATSAGKYDIGIKVKPQFLDQIDPMFLSYLFEYYHLRKVWYNYSYGTLTLKNIRIKEVRSFPIVLTGEQGSASIEIPCAAQNKESCWMYNVLTDLPNGLPIHGRKIGKSYPTSHSPFQTVALYDVVPHDNPKFTDRFLEEFNKRKAAKELLEDKYGNFRPMMYSGNSCPAYSLTYPKELRQIEDLGVFVHANRHKSSYRRPGRSYIDNSGDIISMTTAEKSSMNMPTRSVQVGIRGKIMDPNRIPSKDGLIDVNSGDFIFFSPFVPFWRKITPSQKSKMEEGIQVDISTNPVLVRADMILLGNQPGSRLPFVVVWGGVFQ